MKRQEEEVEVGMECGPQFGELLPILSIFLVHARGRGKKDVPERQGLSGTGTSVALRRGP
jgi:hypothetical protein